MIAGKSTIEYKNKCSGCSACVNSCPLGIVFMKEDTEGFLYPHISDVEKCNHCGVCEHVCHYADSSVIPTTPKNVIACKCKDNDIREESSSGGIFSVLAELALSDGGVVFGASFDENCVLIHSFEEDEDYKKFRTSKYVQSDLRNVFVETKTALDNGRKVLFTGTPCQITGLKSFLQKDYENLFCVDFICHGVPSPKMLRMHLDELSQNVDGEIVNIRFRTKKGLWKKCTTTTITTITGHVFSIKRDSFMLGFLQNLYLRPSCHNCNVNNHRSKADISIGDYWGCETKYRKFDDERGVSLILIRSDKGINTFASIEHKMDFMEIELDHPLIFNPNIVRSTRPNKNRDVFFKLIDEGLPFSECVKKFTVTHIELVREVLSPGQVRWIQLILSKLKKTKRI